MNSNNNPSIDPADNGSLAGSIRFAFNKLLQQVNGMLPAKVIRYDRTANRVQIELLIAILTTDGSQIPRPQIASLPVLLLGGGGYMLNFPLNEGDLGWVLANDRDISLFLQTYTQSPPNTSRIKNFSDGLFIPDVMRGFTIDGEDEGNAVLQSIDGSIRIALWPDKVKITAPSLEVEGDLIVSGEINGSGGLVISGGVLNAVTVTGNMRVVGDITASGDITPHVP